MKRFIEGVERTQSTLFPDRLEDWIGEDNAVRVVDVFVDELDLCGLGFGRVAPRATGRPSYHPSVLLKLYIYGYLNRVQSSRRLEREAVRNAHRRLRSKLAAYHAAEIGLAELDASIRGWINHVGHADSWGLRRHVLDALPIRPAVHRRAKAARRS